MSSQAHRDDTALRIGRAVLAGARQPRRPNHRVLDGDPDSHSSSSDATR